MLCAYALYFGYLVHAFALHLGPKSERHLLPQSCVLTWFLFAAGTALHISVEVLYGVSLRGLYADMVCGMMSAGIAVACIVIKRRYNRKIAAGFKDGRDDRGYKFQVKFWYAQCALIYLMPEIMMRTIAPEFLSEFVRFWCGTISLLALTFMGVLEFVPILKETAEGKTQEWTLPWLVSTLAYAMMWLVRVEDMAAAAAWSREWMVMVYEWMAILHPASSLLLHLLMAVVAIIGARPVLSAQASRLTTFSLVSDAHPTPRKTSSRLLKI